MASRIARRCAGMVTGCSDRMPLRFPDCRVWIKRPLSRLEEEEEEVKVFMTSMPMEEDCKMEEEVVVVVMALWTRAIRLLLRLRRRTGVQGGVGQME